MISNSFLLGLSLLCISYLLGSFPSGFLAGKWLANVDLRNIGSGSTGATNVLRHIGKKAAFVVFIIDVAKGMAPILLAKFLNLDDNWQVASGLLALAGHIWPIWLKWKGGKAVATGLGLFLGLSWSVGVGALIVFLIILSFSKIVSLASILAATSLPIFMFLSFEKGEISYTYISLSLVSMFMVLWRHRSNLKRLIKGIEPKIGKSR